jgi:hypothetical protein
VLQNAAGHDVHVHITNYQDRYYGGAAMIRLYHFDLARNRIDVEPFSPWFLARDPAKRTPLEAETIELTGDVDRFSLGDGLRAAVRRLLRRPRCPRPGRRLGSSTGTRSPTGGSTPPAGRSRTARWSPIRPERATTSRYGGWRTAVPACWPPRCPRIADRNAAGRAECYRRSALSSA